MQGFKAPSYYHLGLTGGAWVGPAELEKRSQGKLVATKSEEGLAKLGEVGSIYLLEQVPTKLEVVLAKLEVVAAKLEELEVVSLNWGA